MSASTTSNAVAMLVSLEGEDMARRRSQRSGWLRAKSGNWLLTYRMYIWDPETHKTKPQRVTVTIGPAPDPPKSRATNGQLTERQAERFAWEHYLAPLDNATVKPFSTQTLGQFWETKYLSYLERKKKYATQSQYKSLWKVWIEPFIGRVRLFELKPDQVDGLISKALAAKKGTATAKHIKKVVSAVIEHARMLQMFTGENPAQLIELPNHVPVRRRHAMDVEQCRRFVDAVIDKPADPKDRRSDIQPLRTMSMLGICCSLGVSEQLGLQWKHVNLSAEAVIVDGDTVEPLSLAIRAHSYHGRAGTLKTGNRRRNIPLPRILVDALTEIRRQSKWTGPDDPVFAGAAGKPIWADNLVKRELKPIAEALGMPWLSPHVLRHTCATLTKSFGMLDVDRRTLMGHADQFQTDRYTSEDWARMRVGIEKVASEITKPPKCDDEASKPRNVVGIDRRKAG